jgi:hypothetical protein
MTEPENFLARWSRLKRQRKAIPATRRDVGEVEAAAEGLPPIHSIEAGTDIRAFLRAGVPAELTRAALRRAWARDPAVRDFVGIAESQWDFTDPTAMPGFGPLQQTDDVPRLVAQVLGEHDRRES